ncbi:MAG: diguanylate cyclase [Gammaproteobacteria bacterium]|nr:diguanylate cyclase [Gammaproteobacteria bacterium]
MDSKTEIAELYQIMEVLHSIDAGLIIIDLDYHILEWNRFMEDHSGRRLENVVGKNILSLYPDIPKEWFRRKMSSVLALKSRTYTSWEQRPFLIRFNSSRPITSPAQFMYQNITFIPLLSLNGMVDRVIILITDVTEIAINKILLEETNSKLEALSRLDRLTQLYNRGYWEECLTREFSRTLRTRQPCSLIMFDIDHFKKINDSYGHPAGDEIIRQTAEALRGTIRSTDIAGRYGGEEFGFISIGSNAEDSLVVAERLRERIAALAVEYEGHTIRYTISLGIAGMDQQMKSHKDWISATDQALYKSKESGRNRATIYRAP